MADHRITDFVDQSAIDSLINLKNTMTDVKDVYSEVAKELAKGLNLKVDGIEDLERIIKTLAENQGKAAEATERLRVAEKQYEQAAANTTNTISRQLMEQEKLNERTRDAYTRQQEVKAILKDAVTSYNEMAERVAALTIQQEKLNKKKADEKKAYESGRKSYDDYQASLAAIIKRQQELAAEKSQLMAYITSEAKENNNNSSSYNAMSQELLRLKKAYRELDEEGRSSDFGQSMLAEIKELGAHLKDLDASMGDFQRNVGDYAIACQGGVVVTESLNQVLGMNAATVAGCIEQNKSLADAKNKLDTSDANYADTLDKINAKMAENNARISDVSTIMGVSAKTIGEAEEQNKMLSEALKLIDVTADGAKEQIAAINAKIEENNKVIQENSGESQSIKKSLKELVLEIANLTIQYQALSEEEQNSAAGTALKEHIQELTEKAGVLKDAISDTNQAISNAASDTRGFDQLSGALQLSIDGFGLATGAAEMLGISSGELTEIQTKLQAAIAASNAMQSIQNTLQAQSAVMQAVNLSQTKARVVAENLHTAAKGKGTIATAALTAAQWLFNAAASANPIGLLVIAITAAIAAVYGLVKAFQAFFGPSKEQLQNYQDQKQALEDLCESNDKLIDRMKARGATESELLNQSLQNKEAEKKAADELFAQAQELYDEDEDEYKEALEAKRKADEEYEATKEDSLNYLLKVIHESEEEEKKERLGTYEYKRQLIQAELAQQKAIAAQLLAQEKITREVYENLCASLDKAAQMKIEKVNTEETNANKPRSTGRSSGGGSSRADDAKKQAEDLKKAVQAGEDALLQIITDSLERQRQAELLSYARKLQELEEQLAATKDTQVQLRQALNNQIEGLTAEHNRKMEALQMQQIERYNKAEADFISSHLDIVEAGSQEELDWKLKALANQQNAELIAIAKAENDKTITAEQAAEMRANLVIKYGRLEDEARAEFTNAQVEKVEEQYATEQIVRDQAYAQAQNALKAQLAAGLISREEYESQLAEMSEQYAMDSAQATIDMLKEALNTEDLTDEQRAALMAKLAQAQIDYETAAADASVAASERKAEADKASFEKRMENVQKWLSVASDALNAFNDLASAIYDNKIQQVEEELEAVEESGDEEQEYISDLVNKKVISEEEGEARKRAAEAKTAKKKEELEKKKQQLQHKQAVWDKANQVAQCGINTAASIVQTAANLGFPAAIPFIAIAGAMGAVQLATILATPIPKYAKGTDFHPGGLAVVGDAGRPELVEQDGQFYVTPSKATLVDIPRGATVYPDASAMIVNDLMREASEFSPDPKSLLPLPPRVVVNNDYKALERGQQEIVATLKAQSRLQRKLASEQAFQQFMLAKGL